MPPSAVESPTPPLEAPTDPAAVRALLSRAVRVPVTALLILSGLLLGLLALGVSQASWVQRAETAVNEARRVETALVEAQSGLHDIFFFNRAPDASARTPSSRIGETIEGLGRLVADEPDQVDRVAILRRRQVEWAQCRDTVAPDVRPDASMRESVLACTEPALDDMRRILGDVIAVEEQQRNRRAQGSRKVAFAATGGGLALALGAGAGLAIIGRRQLKALGRAYREAFDEQDRLRADLRRHADSLEVRVAQRTRALSEVNAELEAFAYSVSHDLRAPLRSMQGFANALLDDYAPSLDSAGRDYAERVVSAAHRMDALIEDLLAYSRLGRADLELVPVELSPLVAGVVKQLDAAIKESGAELEVVEPLPRMVAHRATLAQIVLNLLTNAMKFVPEGRRPHVRVSGAVTDGRARLSVADNGIGIAPEHQERIFRVFERLHGPAAYAGTGIGLAIVRKGVERMGGRVGLESRVGEGTTFWIELRDPDA